MMKRITIREAYDWLHLGKDINQVEWDELLEFLQSEYKDMVEIGIRRLRFINLVGVIQLASVRIEILPKLEIDSESEEKNREALLNMLVVTKTFPVQIHESTFGQLAKADLLQIFAEVYTKLLLKEVRRGIYKEYKIEQENSETLKGRLLVTEQVQRNAFMPIRAYCEFDTFQEDIRLNRIFKSALKLIIPHLKRSGVRSDALFIMNLLQNVDEGKISKTDLDKVKFNRQNKRFENIFKIAKMILLQEMTTSRYNNQTSFSILFEMNMLYEAYIEKCLHYLTLEKNIEVFSQHDRKHLLINIKSGKENIKLKPDFYLVSPDDEIIIDTKWKNVAHEGRLLYSQADLYQMYAYITSYQKVSKCILLYPRTEVMEFPLWKVPEEEKYIGIHTVRLTSFKESIDDLDIVLNTY